MARFSCLLLLLVVWLVGCGQSTTPPRGNTMATASPLPATATPLPGASLDYSTFLSQLQAKGATVVMQGDVNQPFFAVPGHILLVNGGRVEVHEYLTPLDCTTDAARISPDGTQIGSTHVGWVDDPHFFKAGRVLVLYTGKDMAILQLLTSLLGPQVAGH